jgi:PAS domain S-box-containing protein
MNPTYEELLQQIAELEKRNWIFDSIVTQSPAGILVTDDKGAIEYVNDTFHSILGYSPEEMNEELIYTILQGEESISLYKEMTETVMKGEIWRGELKEKRIDGKVIWVRQTLFPIHHEGRITNYISIFTDITQQKENEERKNEQERLYKLLVDNLPLLISIYDLNGTFLYANDLTDKFFRMKPGEVTGKNFREIFPAEAADEQYKNLQEILRTGRSTIVNRSFRMHGHMNYFRATHQPMFNENGEITSILVIGQDVTEQERQAELLRVQHEIDSLSNLTTSLPASLKKAFQYLLEIDWVDSGGIYLFDEDRKKLRLVFSTGLSEDYLKHISVFSYQDLPVKTILKGKSRYAQTRYFLEPIKKVMEKEALTLAVSIPLIYKKDVIGSLNLGSRSTEEISDHDRLVIESIASRLANLIILVKTREELLSSNLKLNKSIREKEEQQQLLIQKSRLESLGELSAGLAHEINQPLSVISLIMENIHYKLEQKAASEEYLSGKFSTITQNINKIRKLIDHVKIFSRDQGSIMFEKVDVNQVIKDSLSMIEAQLKNHDIKITTELACDIGFTLGNPSRVEQVMLNLLSNARDALDEKENMNISQGPQKEIRVTSYCDLGHIVVKVWDNGTGISKENLDKIYNPFFTTKPEGRGTGLGLAIVYGIIREMKGEIMVRSEEMEFTEITIIFKGYKNAIQKQ